MGSSSDLVKPITIKLVFAASQLSTHSLRSKSKDWFAWNQDNVYMQTVVLVRGHYKNRDKS